MAKLTILAEIDLYADEASDLLSAVSDVLTDWMEALDAGQGETVAKTSGVFTNDPEDDDEEPFGTWKWE